MLILYKFYSFLVRTFKKSSMFLVSHQELKTNKFCIFLETKNEKKNYKDQNQIFPIL